MDAGQFVDKALQHLPGIGKVWPSRGNPRGARWQALQSHLLLSEVQAPQVPETLTYSVAELTAIMGKALPAAAKRKPYWSDEMPHAWAWVECSRTAQFTKTPLGFQVAFAVQTGPFDLDPVPLPETLEQDHGHLRWRFEMRGQIQLDANGRLAFPPVRPGPGVYRLSSRQADALSGVYVGESGNVRSRFETYRTPDKNKTNVNVNRWLREEVATPGVEVTVDCVLEAEFVQMLQENEILDLRHRPARLFVENLLLVRYWREGVQVQNL
jgi:hypothetical protein